MVPKNLTKIDENRAENSSENECGFLPSIARIIFQFTFQVFFLRLGSSESRVAKCQIFYTDQFFPNEFTPRKSAYIVTNCRPKIHEMGKEGKFNGKFYP